MTNVRAGDAILGALSFEDSVKTLADRLWSNVSIGEPDECWQWTASTDKDGYGKIRRGDKHDRAHRVAYELSTGPIPDGLFVCHSCDNPGCVNPGHFFLGTSLDNNRDRARKGRSNPWQRGKTHCKRGHEFTEANTGYHASGRYCRTCVNEQHRDARARNPVAVRAYHRDYYALHREHSK